MTDDLYTRTATADHKALIIYLLDISRSMGTPMEKGTSRLDAVMAALKFTITEMVQRSLKQNKIRPRYRVAMLAYSDKLWDILDGAKTVDIVSQKGIPQLIPQQRTNTALGFRQVKKMLLDDLATWTREDMQGCPAPLVVHMTDGELNEISDDPEPTVREIQAIKVPDGNVLVENIYVTNEAKLGVPDIKVWPGYCHGDDTGNPYGNKLLSMSSKLPAPYLKLINSHQQLGLRDGATMLFPGTTPQFVREAFVMNGVSGIVGDKPNPWSEE